MCQNNTFVCAAGPSGSVVEIDKSLEDMHKGPTAGCPIYHETGKGNK